MRGGYKPQRLGIPCRWRRGKDPPVGKVVFFPCQTLTIYMTWALPR